jgi:hypothetical protein
MTPERYSQSERPIEFAKAELARHVLGRIRRGETLAPGEAIQLRNWAIRPGDAMLSLEEIACGILKLEERLIANAAE